MKTGTPTFAVLYRWKLKEGLEQQFIDAWAEVTRALYTYGGLGSRLHKGPDSIWYAYAQWPTAEAREQAFEGFAPIAASAEMKEAVLERLPEIPLEVVKDLLLPFA